MTAMMLLNKDSLMYGDLHGTDAVLISRKHRTSSEGAPRVLTLKSQNCVNIMHSLSALSMLLIAAACANMPLWQICNRYLSQEVDHEQWM